MVGPSISVILSQLFAVGWLAVYVYSRRQAEQAKRDEEAKYAVWDTAYKQAVKAGKTEYYALMDAVKAVNGGPAVLRVWDDTFNKAVNSGVRKYKAGLMATAAARKAAHS
jgi:hypothetical protein